MDGHAVAVADEAKHHLERLHLDDSDRHHIGSEEELVEFEAAGGLIAGGQEGLFVQLGRLDGVAVIEPAAGGYGGNEHIWTQIDIVQARWRLRPRIDRDVSSLCSDCIEERVIAEAEQLDPRCVRRRRERIEEPAGRVIEPNGHSDPGRLARTDPACGQHRPFNVSLELGGRARKMVPGWGEPKGSPARLGELRPRPSLGFGKTMTGCGRADVERPRSIAQPAELADGGKELKVGAIQSHMHMMQQYAAKDALDGTNDCPDS